MSRPASAESAIQDYGRQQMRYPLRPEASAAFLVVRLANKYDLPSQYSKAYVASQCVLAVWGYSGYVREMSNNRRVDNLDAILEVLQNREGALKVLQVAKRMPFMYPAWKFDLNDNHIARNSRAIEILSHAWEHELWSGYEDVVRRACNHCSLVGRRVQSLAVECLPPAYKATNSAYRLREIGAQVADVVAPNARSTTSVHASCKRCLLRETQHELDAQSICDKVSSVAMNGFTMIRDGLPR